MGRGEHITRTFKILDSPRCPWCGARYDETPEHPHPFVKGEAGSDGEFCKNCGKWGEFKHIPFGKAIIITGVMMLYGYVVYSLEIRSAEEIVFDGFMIFPVCFVDRRGKALWKNVSTVRKTKQGSNWHH